MKIRDKNEESGKEGKKRKSPGEEGSFSELDTVPGRSRDMAQSRNNICYLTDIKRRKEP